MEDTRWADPSSREGEMLLALDDIITWTRGFGSAEAIELQRQAT